MTITINPKNKKELAKIKAILKAVEIDFVEENSEEDWYDELSDAEKKSIELGLKDIEGGRVVAHSEVKKIYEKWL
jgi:predicted transcriptional regulator